ncbi:hypothetical protein CWR48_14070 [Oceanobacillus arenosus]|uniref:Phage protein n=1 Tax=Oceanobacillus arenosus TaxID=1229153 RepID=A0A3D8PNF2_9BACI|nr:hypothetical protein [Oceanobacillus arenosus]RDW17636.1 hypothetical protein CWR48_14070 [Oceanobacillus arenosus]
MQIKIEINDEEQTFYTPKVPVSAKRKYLEVMAKSEEKAKDNENYVSTYQDQLDEEFELAGVLADVVFKGQFTVEQLFDGVESDYLYEKLAEAVFGKKKEGNEGNNQGK